MAPLKRYSIGDQVELKSGSPDMTVTAIFEESVAVAWCGSDDSGVLHQSELPLGAIQPVENGGTSARSPSGGGFGYRAPQPAFARNHLDDDIPF